MSVLSKLWTCTGDVRNVIQISHTAESLLAVRELLDLQYNFTIIAPIFCHNININSSIQTGNIYVFRKERKNEEGLNFIELFPTKDNSWKSDTVYLMSRSYFIYCYNSAWKESFKWGNDSSLSTKSGCIFLVFIFYPDGTKVWILLQSSSPQTDVLFFNKNSRTEQLILGYIHNSAH